MRWRTLNVLFAAVALVLAILGTRRSSPMDCGSGRTVLPLLGERVRVRANVSSNCVLATGGQPGTNVHIRETLSYLQSLDVDSDSFHAVVDNLPLAQVLLLLNEIGAKSDAGSGELASPLISHWAEEDSVAAGDWAGQLAEEPFRTIACEQVAIAWAGNDLPAVSEWLKSLPDGESKSVAIRAAAYEASRTDPLSGLELTVQLPPDEARDDLLDHTVRQWAAGSADNAAEWVKRIEDEQLRSRLLGAIAVGMAEQDPQAAARFLSANISPGEQQDRVAVIVAAQWAQSAPALASAWVAQFPEGAARDAAIKALKKLTE